MTMDTEEMKKQHTQNQKEELVVGALVSKNKNVSNKHRIQEMNVSIDDNNGHCRDEEATNSKSKVGCWLVPENSNLH